MANSQAVIGISSQTWPRYHGDITDCDRHRTADCVFLIFVLLTTIEYKIAIFLPLSTLTVPVYSNSKICTYVPLIYNKRCSVVFRIFNPAGIVLTAFILNVYFSHLKLMISLKFVIQVVRQVYQKVRC